MSSTASLNLLTFKPLSPNPTTLKLELFECVWPFGGVGAWRVKNITLKKKKTFRVRKNLYYLVDGNQFQLSSYIQLW